MHAELLAPELGDASCIAAVNTYFKAPESSPSALARSIELARAVPHGQTELLLPRQLDQQELGQRAELLRDMTRPGDLSIVVVNDAAEKRLLAEQDRGRRLDRRLVEEDPGAIGSGCSRTLLTPRAVSSTGTRRRPSAVKQKAAWIKEKPTANGGRTSTPTLAGSPARGRPRSYVGKSAR